MRMKYNVYMYRNCTHCVLGILGALTRGTRLIITEELRESISLSSLYTVHTESGGYQLDHIQNTQRNHKHHTHTDRQIQKSCLLRTLNNDRTRVYTHSWQWHLIRTIQRIIPNFIKPLRTFLALCVLDTQCILVGSADLLLFHYSLLELPQGNLESSKRHFLILQVALELEMDTRHLCQFSLAHTLCRDKRTVTRV